ncbi:MAG: succinylglutamate desuccinylase [Bacteroidetes bacterium]|nr:MAG: succinylglutamate desuccinylase [Bacteroidota bacterium]PTM09371.1 MAG: succinylglutamate desuccinylase [Bacteroidota bacterium]
MESNNRVIGHFKGSEHGPLVIVFGGMHGNEPAGVLALESLFQLLKTESKTKPGFVFRGRLLGLRGNTRALVQGLRFVAKDLNRQFSSANIAQVTTSPLANLADEDLELREILDLIHAEIAAYPPTRIIVLDLHTTTAHGGIFCIPTDDPESIHIAKAMHAPVIIGMLRGLQGTTLHYFCTANFSCPTVGVSFEAGQHHDPLSAQRALAAIINLLRSVGSLRPNDIENHYDDLLLNFSQGLPLVAELFHVHRIAPTDTFLMKSGYHNFQVVQAGEVLAHDQQGPVTAPADGLILMPLYQKQGEDGFFLVKLAE